jgi:hypothetical protein
LDDNWLENLKGKLNNFLWCNMPGEVTLDRLEKLAVNIMDLCSELDNEIIRIKKPEIG